MLPPKVHVPGLPTVAEGIPGSFPSHARRTSVNPHPSAIRRGPPTPSTPRLFGFEGSGLQS